MIVRGVCLGEVDGSNCTDDERRVGGGGDPARWREREEATHTFGCDCDAFECGCEGKTEESGKEKEKGKARRGRESRKSVQEGRAIARSMHQHRHTFDASRQVLLCYNLRRRRPSERVFGVPAATSTPHAPVQ